jgi:protein Tob/BTG
MHLEIQLALNYLLQNLYNKLPRRRVNLFGEELSNQLKLKYTHHWYPGNPNKGSAYRCLKTPTDPIISSAADAVNVPLKDIIEHLPEDLWIWIDPGEVSYRVGGGGTLRVLWRGNSDGNNWEGLGSWRDRTDLELDDMELDKSKLHSLIYALYYH